MNHWDERPLSDVNVGDVIRLGSGHNWDPPDMAFRVTRKICRADSTVSVGGAQRERLYPDDTVLVQRRTQKQQRIFS
jgi:hypothetical protein